MGGIDALKDPAWKAKKMKLVDVLKMARSKGSKLLIVNDANQILLGNGNELRGCWPARLDRVVGVMSDVLAAVPVLRDVEALYVFTFEPASEFTLPGALLNGAVGAPNFRDEVGQERYLIFEEHAAAQNYGCAC
jgi:hypothetical protein